MSTDAARRLARALEGALAGSVALDAPLAPFTTYRLGGPAAVLVEVGEPDDLERVAARWDPSALPLLVVGRGSNMLVSDAGFPGLVLHLGPAFSWAREEGPVVRSGGATPMPWLARWASRRGRAGIQFGVAVPGSVGGAVRMNAGAHGTEVVQVLADADVFDLGTGLRRRMPVGNLGLRYRHSGLGAHDVVEAAAFHLGEASRDDLEAEMKEIVRWRKANQPGGQPNAGSVFANPPGDSAGRLIDVLGAKGWREGGAEVSSKHANFIVTHQGASSTDVARLVARVREAVHDRFGVRLRPEMRLVGDYPADVYEALVEDES